MSADQTTTIAAAMRGDCRAFDLIVELYQGRIARYLLRLVNDHELALDLTQDTFINAFRNIRSLRSEAALCSWLFRIATNLAIQARSRGRRILWQSLANIEDSAQVASEPPDALVIDRELIGETLAQLPRDRAACLILHITEGFNYEEIAEIMNTTTEAVRKRVARAKEQFRAQYDAATSDAYHYAVR